MRLRTALVGGLLWAGLIGTPSFANDGFARLQGHGGPIKGVAISADGELALTASFDYSVGLWRLSDGKLIRRLEGHEAAANAVAFHPNGRDAMSVGDDFRTLTFDLRDGGVTGADVLHKGKLLDIEVSNDGSLAVSSGWDGVAVIWDLTHQAGPRVLSGHQSGVNDAVISSDGATIYTAGQDGTIRVWDAASGDLKRTLVKHGFGVNRMVLNDAAGWLAYGAVDGAVRAIDLNTDDELADLTADRRPILALALSSDGGRVAVGDGEGYVMIIDAQDWTITRDFRAAARGPIWALAWTPDGKRLLSGGIDDDAVLWPVAAATEEVEGILGTAERSFLKDPSEMTNGERQFARKCSICHTLTPDGRNRAGPTLHGLFGRQAGSVPDYNYSQALAGADIIWEAETINRLFDEGPDHYTPGSKMPMQQIAKQQDRDDLIAFLTANTGPRADGKTADTNGETSE